jgi:hypothetical protein
LVGPVQCEELAVNKFPEFSPAPGFRFVRRSAVSCYCVSSESEKALICRTILVGAKGSNLRLRELLPSPYRHELSVREIETIAKTDEPFCSVSIRKRGYNHRQAPPHNLQPRYRSTLYTAPQGAHFVRDPIAEAVLKIPKDTLRVITPNVGGAFGMKAFVKIGAGPRRPLLF